MLNAYRNEMVVSWKVVNSFSNYMEISLLYGYHGLKYLSAFVSQKTKELFLGRAEGAKTRPVALSLDYTLSLCQAWFER